VEGYEEAIAEFSRLWNILHKEYKVPIINKVNTGIRAKSFTLCNTSTYLM
jgi:hypothetical protein